MKDISILGFNNSNDVLNKMQRDYDNLNKAIITQDSTGINDAFVNFYTYAYHIKDWLKKEGFDSVENYINLNLELSICADLCNNTKHKGLDRKPRLNDPLYEIYQSGIRCDSTAYSTDSTVSINAVTYYIRLISGKEFEILHFVKRILSIWEFYIRDNK